MRKRNRHLLHSTYTDVSLVHPMDVDSFVEGFDGEDSEGLSDFLEHKDTYSEMVSMNDRSSFYYALWMIEYHDKGETPKPVGYLYFNKDPELGALTLLIYIKKDYRNRGIGTTALKMISEWAFFQKDIYEVKCSFDETNDGAISAFSKAGFIYRAVSGHTETYSITKEPSYWSGVYLVHGIWVGCLLSFVFNSFYVGLPVGIVAGLFLGAYLERSEQLHRAEVTGTSLKSARIMKRNRSRSLKYDTENTDDNVE